MSGICSIHRKYNSECRMCNTDIREVLPNFDKKHQEAIDAGLTTCIHCNFEFYRTASVCPKCGADYK